jgi:DNA-binding transcriptional MerR regulator
MNLRTRDFLKLKGVRNSMSTTKYVNIMEAAKRCGVSDKTIRRAIHKGLLPARSPKPNRSEIAVSDLECFTLRHLPGQVQVVSTEDRIAVLEQRVQALEQQIQELLNKPTAVMPRRASRRETRTTGPLPRNLVSLLAFARLHGMAETKVLTHVDISLLPAKRGEWTDHDGTQVTLVLDAKGRQAFYQLYREMPSFFRCEKCPHGYLDNV